jgi:hypothetical protein
MYHAVRQSGYIFILESGSTLVPMSALWVVLSRPHAGKLGRGYRKILLFDEATEFDRLGCFTAGQGVS